MVGKWLAWECMPEWRPKERVCKASGSRPDCLTEPKERVSPLGSLPGFLWESLARASQACPLPESHSRPRDGPRREAPPLPQTHGSSKA